MNSYLAFDLETTGVSWSRDRIIQIGVCLVTDDRATCHETWLLKQPVRVPRAATTVHGITSRMLRDRGLPPRAGFARLIELMNGVPICVGYNCLSFDLPFLDAEARRLQIELPAASRFVDLKALFRGWMLDCPPAAGEAHADYARRVFALHIDGQCCTLAACLATLGIDACPPEPSLAATDARLIHLAYAKLLPLLNHSPMPRRAGRVAAGVG